MLLLRSPPPTSLVTKPSSSCFLRRHHHRHPVFWGPRRLIVPPPLHHHHLPAVAAVRQEGNFETAATSMADRGHTEGADAAEVEVNEEGRSVFGSSSSSSHEDGGSGGGLTVGVGNSNFPLQKLRMYRMSPGDQAFFLLSFIACTTSIAFTSLVIAAVPTLFAMKRAASSLAKLADTAREELPSTMAAIRLSGMEISDLTLELSDLSQEIADGVSKSAQAVQAAEAGIRQIGALARHRTISMIQERASLPNISLQPVVAGAAKKTSRVVGQARKTFMNIISRADYSLEDEESGSKGVDTHTG